MQRGCHLVTSLIQREIASSLQGIKVRGWHGSSLCTTLLKHFQLAGHTHSVLAAWTMLLLGQQAAQATTGQGLSEMLAPWWECKPPGVSYLCASCTAFRCTFQVGLAHIFIQHTSASLTINENAGGWPAWQAAKDCHTCLA